ncbi:MAG: hypothetical protein K1060chlam3_00271 [Candidatus Anoxychlamydiales bacterium]|nr:hypothetical protein [Candidatus Anoxychlamydiales bacterium]
MAASTCTNRFEKNVLTLANLNTCIYNYYIKASGDIVNVDHVDAIFVETFSNLNDCFNITTQKNNLDNLLSRVKSLNNSEAKYDQDTRERMCNWVLRKFQSTFDQHKDLLEKKENELAIQKAEVSDLLDRTLPSVSIIAPENRPTDASSLARQLDNAFDNLENNARRDLENTESCSEAARRSHY